MESNQAEALTVQFTGDREQGDKLNSTIGTQGDRLRQEDIVQDHQLEILGKACVMTRKSRKTIFRQTHNQCKCKASDQSGIKNQRQNTLLA